MSEAMHEQHVRELQEWENKEKTDMEAIDKDSCPGCGMKAKTFVYINAPLLAYGLLECTWCGTVFAPESMRLEKKKFLRSGTDPAIIPASKEVGRL